MYCHCHVCHIHTKTRFARQAPPILKLASLAILYYPIIYYTILSYPIIYYLLPYDPHSLVSVLAVSVTMTKNCVTFEIVNLLSCDNDKNCVTFEIVNLLSCDNDKKIV